MTKHADPDIAGAAKDAPDALGTPSRPRATGVIMIEMKGRSLVSLTIHEGSTAWALSLLLIPESLKLLVAQAMKAMTMESLEL